jgi:hypothetical protein
MTTVLQNIDKPIHPLTESVIKFLLSERSDRVYMGVHTSLRSALYKDAYIAESYNKDYYAKQIASNYLPVLEYLDGGL